MKTLPVVAGIVLSLVSVTAFAASPKMVHSKKMASPTTYECAKCHMKYDAATAKKDHFKDPMDGGKLVPVKAAKAMKPAPKMKSMGGMKM